MDSVAPLLLLLLMVAARGDLLVNGGSSMGPSPSSVGSSWPWCPGWWSSARWAQSGWEGAARMRGLLLLWMGPNSGTILTKALALARLVWSLSRLSSLLRYLGQWSPVSPLVV